MFEFLQSLKFYQKRHAEIQVRIEFLAELEKVWTLAWEYRFGQLIEYLLSQGLTAFYTEKTIRIDLIVMPNQQLPSEENDEKSLLPLSPARIPNVMRRFREEWINSRASFGDYLIRRLKEERPGGSLNGYDFPCEARKV